MERGDTGTGMTCSVVIPVRNDAEYLRRCLRALAYQSRPPDEIVVVDNGSTDHLSRVLQDHGAVRVVSEPVPGVARAAAAGYDAAGGDMILRCDADSIPPGSWVERHMAVLRSAGGQPCAHAPGRSTGWRQGREIVAVSGIARFGPRWSTAGSAVGALYITAYRVVAGTALGHAALWGSDMAFCRDWWVGVRDGVHLSDGIHDDFDLSFRVAAQQRVLVDPRNRVTVSWRAATSPARIVRQLRMAAETVRVNRAQQPLWVRWRERVAVALGARRARGRPSGPGTPW